MASKSERITLQVSDRTFITTKSTLAHGLQSGSKYFEHKFNFDEKLSLQDPSPGDDSVIPSYYLDLDPDIFTHVLDYLKSGVMPLLWTQEKGFDYISYAKLERMADFLQVDRLVKWVRDRKYTKAVQQSFKVSRHESHDFTKNIPFDPTYGTFELILGGGDQKHFIAVGRVAIIDKKILFDE